MKLLRYGTPGQEKPGMIDSNGQLRDLSAHVGDIDGSVIGDESLEKLRGLDAESLPAVSGNPRIGPCVNGVGKFICIGLNYSDHAAEAGQAVPSEPIVFMKANSAISGPDDDVILPKGSVKSDWEVELGFVIGTKAKYVSESNALDYVAGYCVINDVSEREYQLERDNQWIKGKSCDTYGPLGPWLVTRDEVPDPQTLDVWLDVNGERLQKGNTNTMIFSVQHLVHYLSQFMTLYPGDVIATGTPPGVGLGFKPPKFLKAGDVMRLSIAGLGEQQQKVVAHTD